MSRKFKILLILSLIGNLAIFYVGYKALEYRAHINEYLDKYTNVVNEFSGRHHFAEANTALVSDSVIPGRLVFLGTQVTAGWNLEETFPGYEVINRGLPGQLLSGMLLRFRPDVIDLGPEAVIIEVSSYNFRSQSTVKEIYDYVVSLIELANAEGIKAYPATIIPILMDSSDFGDYHILDSIGLCNERIISYCNNNDLQYLDFNAVLSDSGGYLIESYASGAIDLNVEGYNRISKEVRQKLGSQR